MVFSESTVHVPEKFRPCAPRPADMTIIATVASLNTAFMLTSTE
jgi:hypothetical protein